VHLLISAISDKKYQVKNEAGVGGDPELSLDAALHRINPLKSS